MPCYDAIDPPTCQHSGTVYLKTDPPATPESTIACYFWAPGTLSPAVYTGPSGRFYWQATVGPITGASEGYGRKRAAGGGEITEVLFSKVVQVKDLSGVTELDPPVRICS